MPRRVPAVPISFAPIDGEAGVLSVLAMQGDEEWSVAAGSLTPPSEIVDASWQARAKAQPSRGRPPGRLPMFQLGAEFDEEPFPGVRVIHLVITPKDWLATVHGLPFTAPAEGRRERRAYSLEHGEDGGLDLRRTAVEEILG
jgi:hypothetical protein